MRSVDVNHGMNERFRMMLSSLFEKIVQRNPFHEPFICNVSGYNHNSTLTLTLVIAFSQIRCSLKSSHLRDEIDESYFVVALGVRLRAALFHQFSINKFNATQYLYKSEKGGERDREREKEKDE